MKYLSGIMACFIITMVAPRVDAQWWGSDSLPGNANNYTYRTRLGDWQYGALLRNVTTPQPFAGSGIIRDWEDGMPIAVDRNRPGGRFAQMGVPNLVYVPRINYFDDLGVLTDFQYRDGLRQYWPEDQRLLIDEWEQITYEPEHLPASSGMTAAAKSTGRDYARETFAPSTQQRPAKNKAQLIVVKKVPIKKTQPEQSYHQLVMQRHAERREVDAKRNERHSSEFEAIKQNTGFERNAINHHEGTVSSEWLRDSAASQFSNPASSFATGHLPSNEMPATTYIISGNHVAELEKRLEYDLVTSPEVSFFSPFQTKFENGVVIVTGVVGTDQQRLAAERILLSRPEVQHVRNNLTVVE